MRRSSFLAALLVLATVTARLGAQDTTRVSPNDSVFRRARRMVAEGKGAAGRALVDTVLHRYEDGTTGYGDALFWRGALAETAADAERDYRRVIVEYPLSFYVDDALLAIAELEQARGDRAAALSHLQRFVREHPVSSPSRGVAAFAAARLAFEQRETRTACALIADARTSTPAANVELRNQIEYYVPRCSDLTVPSAPPAAPAVKDTVVPVAPPTRKTAIAKPPVKQRDTTKIIPKPAPAPVDSIPAPPVAVIEKPAKPHPVTAAPKTEATGHFTIQLAAYNTEAEAQRLVIKLASKDVKARVSGTAKPFRVRLAFYPTRHAAAAEVAALKERGIIGFVTTEEPGTSKP